MYKLLYPTGGVEDPEQMRNISVFLHQNDVGKWIEIALEDKDNEDACEVTLFIDEVDLLIEHLHAVKKVLNGN